MKILSFLVFLMIPVLAWGSPFLVCDPYPATDGVDSFGVTINDADPIDSPAEMMLDGTTYLHFDTASLPPGLYSFQVTARRSADLAESAPVPFGWTKGEPLSNPTGIRLMR